MLAFAIFFYPIVFATLLAWLYLFPKLKQAEEPLRIATLIASSGVYTLSWIYCIISGNEMLDKIFMALLIVTGFVTMVNLVRKLNEVRREDPKESVTHGSDRSVKQIHYSRRECPKAVQGKKVQGEKVL